MSAAPRLACRLRFALLASAALAVLSLAACDGRIGGPAPVVAYGASGPSSRLATRAPVAPIESTAGAIVVRPGDTLYAVSRRTNAPVRALIDANNLHPPYALQAGQHLIVPRVRTYHVQSGDTLAALARRYGVGESEIAQANALSPPYGLRTGQVLVLPPGPGAPSAVAPVVAQVPRAPAPNYAVTPPSYTTAPVATASLPQPHPTFSPSPPPPTPAPVAPAFAPAPAPVRAPAPAPSAAHYGPATVAPIPPGAVPLNGPPPPPPPPAVAAVTPVSPAPMPPPPAPVAAQPASLTVTEPPPAPDESVPAAHAGRFIWPVHGAIVSDFGGKPGGLQNDGINIAAARGTPIRAADSGVVVYAGNELRGFGNLLLVKHRGGWVTAYAHAQQILVHRGEEVRRGQVVARVGSSGGVSTPQLHFEVRKGSHPLNPRDYLGPQTASASP